MLAGLNVRKQAGAGTYLITEFVNAKGQNVQKQQEFFTPLVFRAKTLICARAKFESVSNSVHR